MTLVGVHQKLRFAELLENAGQFERAEELILGVLSELDMETDQASIGALHINLGGIARQAGRLEDAQKYLTRAIELLEGIRGDSILQCAHAHLNLATVLLDLRDAAAISHSDKAVELYREFPFSEGADVVDARIASIVSHAWFGSVFDVEEARLLWREMRSVPLGRLTKANVSTFVVMCTSIRLAGESAATEHPFKEMIEECVEWAGKEFASSIERQLMEAGANE